MSEEWEWSCKCFFVFISEGVKIDMDKEIKGWGGRKRALTGIEKEESCGSHKSFCFIEPFPLAVYFISVNHRNISIRLSVYMYLASQLWGSSKSQQPSNQTISIVYVTIFFSFFIKKCYDIAYCSDQSHNRNPKPHNCVSCLSYLDAIFDCWGLKSSRGNEIGWVI